MDEGVGKDRRRERREGRTRLYDGMWRDRDPATAPSGIKPTIRLRAPQTGETVIEDQVQGRVVWREQSTYLYPVRSDQSRRAPSKQGEFPGEPIAEWDVAADAGRRFAVPVRDFNPIHLSDWSARLLGQRSAIAHGYRNATSISKSRKIIATR